MSGSAKTHATIDIPAGLWGSDDGHYRIAVDEWWTNYNEGVILNLWASKEPLRDGGAGIGWRYEADVDNGSDRYIVEDERVKHIEVELPTGPWFDAAGTEHERNEVFELAVGLLSAIDLSPGEIVRLLQTVRQGISGPVGDALDVASTRIAAEGRMSKAALHGEEFAPAGGAR